METKGLEFGLNHTLVQIKWKHHLLAAAIKSQFIRCIPNISKFNSIGNREKLTDS